jgi:hypothetical protein
VLSCLHLSPAKGKSELVIGELWRLENLKEKRKKAKETVLRLPSTNAVSAGLTLRPKRRALQ